MKINTSSSCFSAADSENVELVQQVTGFFFFFLNRRSMPGLFENYDLFLLLLVIIVLSRRFKKYFGKAKQNLFVYNTSCQGITK